MICILFKEEMFSSLSVRQGEGLNYIHLKLPCTGDVLKAITFILMRLPRIPLKDDIITLKLHNVLFHW